VVDASRCTAERRSSLLDQALGRARRTAGPVASALAGLATLALASACGNDETEQSQPAYLTREELLNPDTCRECHSTHYSEWVGSMHAYAAKDPVFVAMNRRGQRETNGALGSFCVNCHAPLAVREAERAGTVVDDWSNFNELPYADQGVGCYFCHNISSVEGTHNAQLSLANDVTMRGRFRDPVQNSAHASAASPFLSGVQPESAAACGSCHDIVLPSPPAPPAEKPVELERTFREWQSSVFAPEHALTPSSMATCAACHMRGGPPRVIADVPGLALPARTPHAHTFPAVDMAFPSVPSTPDPAESQALREEQRQQIQELLDNTLLIEICVELAPLNLSAVYLTIDNANAGHNWPSGASQDRRAWVEVTAYRKGQVLYTNAVPGDREPAADHKDAWIFRDRIFNGDREVHMFWEATRVQEPAGTIGVQLSRSDPRWFNAAHASQRFPVDGTKYFTKPPGDDSGVPDRVTVKVRIRAMGEDVLSDLVQSGDLDPNLVSEIPTFDLLPNRHLAGILPSLAEVSMEWSEAAKNSGRFNVLPDYTGGRQKDCISMVR
jgi:hypothetical protein